MNSISYEIQVRSRNIFVCLVLWLSRSLCCVICGLYMSIIKVMLQKLPFLLKYAAMYRLISFYKIYYIGSQERMEMEQI